jgi:hypothetical protein
MKFNDKLMSSLQHMASKTRNSLSLLAKIVVAVGLIVYLIRSGHLDPHDLWSLMTVRNVVLAVFLIGVNIFMAAYRWILLLRSRGIPLSIGYGLSLYLIGIFFNYALPGAVGGDVVRGYYLVADYPNHRLDVAMSVFIDRVLGLYSFFILTLIAVVFDFDFVMGHEQIRWVAVMAALVFAGMTLFFIVVFSHRLSHALGLGFFEKRVQVVHKAVLAFHRFGQKPVIIAWSVFVSVVAQLVAMLFFYQLALMTGETAITWRAVLFAVPMGFLVTAIPIAPAGIGVGQVAFLYLFKTYLQHDTQFGATAITAYQLTSVVWGLVGAVFYLRRRKPAELNTAVAEMA